MSYISIMAGLRKDSIAYIVVAISLTYSVVFYKIYGHVYEKLEDKVYNKNKINLHKYNSVYFSLFNHFYLFKI